MSKLLNVSSSPHVRCGVSTKNLMYDVAIAMLPATIWGVMQFGIRSLIVVVATVLSCVLSEYIFETLMHKPVTISDGSAPPIHALLEDSLATIPSTAPSPKGTSGFFTRRFASLYAIKDATGPPAPGRAPTKRPIVDVYKESFQLFKISFRLTFAFSCCIQQRALLQSRRSRQAPGLC